MGELQPALRVSGRAMWHVAALTVRREAAPPELHRRRLLHLNFQAVGGAFGADQIAGAGELALAGLRGSWQVTARRLSTLSRNCQPSPHHFAGSILHALGPLRLVRLS